MSYEPICNDCGTKFTANEGGGFVFHLLHCDRCGAERAISFDEIGEPHLRYIKGLSVPYSGVTAEHDRHIQETYPGEPMDRDEYHSVVEQICGTCECGGAFSFEAHPRCPQCRSANLRKDPEAALLALACHALERPLPSAESRNLSPDAIPGVIEATDKVRGYQKWRIHGPEYHQPGIIEPFVRQCWTLKPALRNGGYGDGVEVGDYLNPMFERS